LFFNNIYPPEGGNVNLKKQKTVEGILTNDGYTLAQADFCNC